MLDQKIVRFLKRHHVMSLAVEGPWCAAVFYAFDVEREAFVYTSEHGTNHARIALENPEVGGSIVLETRMVGRLQGVQLRGRTYPTDERWAREAYLRRFPFAAATHLDLWVFEPAHIKYTDNTLGFGKKLIWDRE
jgi:uncharacterized protein YhbP (UPF0306 family)